MQKKTKTVCHFSCYGNSLHGPPLKERKGLMKALKTPNLRLLVAVNALHSMKQDWTNRAGIRLPYNTGVSAERLLCLLG